MVEFLTGLGRANLAAAVVILAVLALRKPVRGLFGARVAYGLWALPALSVAAAFLPARVLVVPALSPAGPAAVTPMPSLEFAGAAVPAVHFVIDPSQALFTLWVAGVATAFAILIRSQRRFLADAADGRVGPAVVGVLLPRIIKPYDFSARFSADEQRLVLAHEAAHITRQDARLNGLIVLAQCLCWFNPLIQLGAYLARIDQEMACDEVVLSRFPSARAAYARALMKAQLAIRPLPLGCYWPSGTEHPLLERLAMIKGEEIGRVRRLTGGAVVAMLAAAGGAAAWAAQPARTLTVVTPAATDGVALADASLRAVLQPAVQKRAPARTALGQPSAVARRAVETSPAEGSDAALTRTNNPATPDEPDASAPQEAGIMRAINPPKPMNEETGQPSGTLRTEPKSALPPVVQPADLISKPTAAQMEDLLPRQAIASGLQGQVVLQCKVLSTGFLSACTVAAQSQPSPVLGATAIRASALFRINPRAVKGEPADESLILIPIKFDVKVNTLGAYPMLPFPSFHGNGEYGTRVTGFDAR
jgi:TonB family protein